MKIIDYFALFPLHDIKIVLISLHTQERVTKGDKMENTINAEIAKLEEKEANGILVDGSTVAAICHITKDFGDKVAVEYSKLAVLAKRRKDGKWTLFNTDVTEQKIKSGVFTKDTVAKWQFFAQAIFGECPSNYIKRVNQRDQAEAIEDFQWKVAKSNLSEQPICDAEYN